MFYTIGAILTAIGFFIGIPIAVVLWDFRKYCKDADHRQIVDLAPFEKYTDFDWLRDYGRIWKPGDLAFWLEPDTCDQLASWQAKYRPRDFGLVVVSDTVRIEWVEPIPDPYPTPLADMQETAYLQSQQQAYLTQSPYGSLLGANYDNYGNIYNPRRSNIRRPNGRRA
jgi:hypothetical protein